MPDIDVVKVLTAKKIQYKALQHEMPKIELDTTCANEVTIYFRSGILVSSIDTV